MLLASFSLSSPLLILLHAAAVNEHANSMFGLFFVIHIHTSPATHPQSSSLTCMHVTRHPLCSVITVWKIFIKCLLSHGDLDGVNHWEHIVTPPAAKATTAKATTATTTTTTTPRSAAEDDAETADGVRGVVGSVSYDVRSELLYNYDTYVLWAAANNA